MKVPLVDLHAQHHPLESELREAFERVVQRSAFILGAEVECFEKAFASYLNVSECVAVSSGTAALHLALMALEIGSGDEVITVPNTFVATVEAISAVGARPVFVDVDPISYTIDPGQVERTVTKRCRAIIPVHLYGQAANMGPLLAIADRHNLAVVEDACQAHGAEYKQTKVGTLGTVGCFSFYPTKNLGCCGEGGAVVTNDPRLAERVRMLRDHGSVRKYEHRFPGYNLRMEGLQGAILTLKLRYLDGWNDRRRDLARQYDCWLEGSGLTTPTQMSYARHVYHLYVVLADDRDRLRQWSASRQIELGLHYPIPVHLQEAYRSLGYCPGDFPVSEKLAKRILSLPMYPGLSPAAVERVASELLECLRCPMLELSNAMQ